MSHGLKKSAAALEDWLAPIFEKTPHLPHNIRETLASIAPWLALIGGILGLIGVWTAGLISVFFAFSFFMAGSQLIWVVALVVMLISSILDLMAFSPLRSRSKRGWNLLFYGIILNGGSTILNMFIGYGSIGQIVGLLIGLWLLFEVRGMYR